jgi:uncharacterized membrane protein
MWIDRRWLAWALGVSLLANCFFIALGFGYFFARADGRLHRYSRPLVSIKRVAALPDDEKQRYFDVMDQRHTEIEAARKAAQNARQAAEAALAISVFDRSKASADLDAMRQANFHLQETVHAALVDALATLSPESRASVLTRGNAEAPPNSHGPQ